MSFGPVWPPGWCAKPYDMIKLFWRLLAYAAAVDAMKGRALAGIATPAKGIEAYVLKLDGASELKTPPYAIVMWQNGAPEELGPFQPSYAPLSPISVAGLAGVASAVSWKLDPVAFDKTRPEFMVGEAPVIVDADQAPEWKLETPTDFLARAVTVKSQSKALVPGQQ